MHKNKEAVRLAFVGKLKRSSYFQKLKEDIQLLIYSANLRLLENSTNFRFYRGCRGVLPIYTALSEIYY